MNICNRALKYLLMKKQILYALWRAQFVTRVFHRTSMCLIDKHAYIQL